MGDKLKPCPFCGHRPLYKRFGRGDNGRWSIGCQNMFCVVKPELNNKYSLRHVADHKWNMRARGDHDKTAE